MNKAQRLIEEAYAKIRESVVNVPQEIKDYIASGGKGNLNLDSQSYPKLTSLPDNLEVHGKLSLENSSIKSLPKNLRVHGKLNLSRTSILTLPNDIKVDGDLELSSSDIKTLPDNLKIGGSLYLAGTKLDKLPKGLEIKGYLFLVNCPITRVQDLPSDLKVHGNIESYYFTNQEAKDYLKKHQRLNKKLSKDFDISVLDDFS